MFKLEGVPQGLTAILDTYGTPGYTEKGKFVVDQAWAKENLQYYVLPFPLRQSWDLKEIRGFWIHKKVGHAMVDALEEIKEFYGLAFMRKHGLDLWGGCYAPRFKRTDSQEPSAHAWAIAIDMCPELGQLGASPTMPWHVVEAFVKRGFEWGGLWDDPDGMHFQACGGY